MIKLNKLIIFLMLLFCMTYIMAKVHHYLGNNNTPSQGVVSMKKVLFILMPENYRDEEFYDPYNMLLEKKYQVDVAGLKDGVAIGSNGHEHIPNFQLNKLTNKDFDEYNALVIPGGPGSVKYLWNNTKIQKIIKYFNENNKIVGAICYGVIAPVQADILTNKKATVSPTQEAKAILQQHNVIFSPDGCVTLENEKIITAQGPKFTKDFGNAIINLLEK